MKRFLSLLLAACLLPALTACGRQMVSGAETTPSKTAPPQSQTTPFAPEVTSEANLETIDETTPTATTETTPSETNPDSSPSPTEPEQPEAAVKTLVVYFSATGNTKAVAERIADLTKADLYELVPTEPYTVEDLDYNVSDCRANREMNDSSARPAIGSDDIDVSEYDTIIIGYPIWWGTMPRIINTFLDTYDLSNKVILPFCTSGSSSISQSVLSIRNAEPDADVRDGFRARTAQDSEMESWLSENVIGE